MIWCVLGRTPQGPDASSAPAIQAAVAARRVYYGGDAWTGKHDLWLRHEALPQLTSHTRHYEAVLSVKARRNRLDAAIEEIATDSGFTPVVRRLGCLRRIGTLTGFALAVELGDGRRFTGNSIGSFVGLVPTEYFSGQPRTQGAITKAGQIHGTTAPATGPGKTMRERWDLAPATARIRGDEATGCCTNAGSDSSTDANPAPCPTSLSRACSPAGAGPCHPRARVMAWPKPLGGTRPVAARGATRDSSMSKPKAHARP